MEEARTYAWILYALEGASQTGPARFSGISMVADGINHAVPTQKEMQSSLKWLMENGMVQKNGSGYQLTEKGVAAVSSAREGRATISQVWAALTSALSACLK